MKTKGFAKGMLSMLAILVLSSNSAQAVVIDFNLQADGYMQDSAVAEDYFASQDLMLGSGVVTACGGACISAPAADYTGVLTGSFIDNIYSYLSFDAVTESTVISLFDGADNLVTTLTSANYTYSGSVGIASFSADLNYDGLYSLTLDGASIYRGSAPEPSTLVLLSLGLAGFGFTRRKMKR